MIQQFYFWVFTQREKKTSIWEDMHILMFIAALFTITKTWKQPESINRWMDEEGVVYVQWNITQSYKEILSFVTTWMNSR